MSISSELFMAILAMDAYNRGYYPGITDSGDSNEGMAGNSIGTAIVGLSADVATYPNAVAASFFAQAYTLANGQTVISYRGTDQPLRDRDDRYASSAACRTVTVTRRDG